MEVKIFKILLINVIFLSLSGLKADIKCANIKCKKRIWTAPAVKGLNAVMCATRHYITGYIYIPASSTVPMLCLLHGYLPICIAISFFFQLNVIVLAYVSIMPLMPNQLVLLCRARVKLVDILCPSSLMSELIFYLLPFFGAGNIFILYSSTNMYSSFN